MTTTIVYSARLHLRFSDLDSYGHVNASHDLDYIVSSRWVFVREHFDLSDKSFIDKGVGFYMSRADLGFLKPSIGVQLILVSSLVSEIQDAKPFARAEMKSDDEKIVFA